MICNFYKTTYQKLIEVLSLNELSRYILILANMLAKKPALWFWVIIPSNFN